VIEFFRKLFSNDFMPHGMCFLWDPPVLWLNVASDALIAAAYYAIPFLLFYFIRKRRDISFKPILAAFGVFILACGTTHLLGAVTVWNPVYRLDGLVKAITAIASVATFAMMIPFMPILVTLPSPSELAEANHRLADEIDERKAAETEVRKINEELEDRVARRTAERRQLEDQLIQAQKMEAVGRLAGGVAHDFNNLLTVILGFGEMAREQVKGDQPAFEAVGEVLQAAERASALTKQLLAFSRRQVATPRVTSLNEVVYNLDKMLRRIIGEDIELKTKLSPGLSPARIDPVHIEQVIMNLAVNARDAMPQGGKLTIETANAELAGDHADGNLEIATGPYAMLTVSDTGVGMDAATKSRIFEPFFTTKDQGKGTGLGLSTVYGIVKQNGGEVKVYSEPGHGTIFKIYFPAVGEHPEALPGESPEAQMVSAAETILLVEDEDQVRHLTRALLARQGYRVLEASSGAAALALVREYRERIDLLLTDVVMPQMSGPDLAREVRSSHPEIRVLFMSGYTDNAVDLQRMLPAATPFVQKPFTSANLQRKVREALRA
jgi:signal transduction histidine kinase/CheY-like chemotaxis protein